MTTAVLKFFNLPKFGRRDSALPKVEKSARVRIVMHVEHSSGREEKVEFDPVVSSAVHILVDNLYQGKRVALLEDQEEVSPEDAGKILGISRPLVVRKMDTGELPYRTVGAHRRLKLADVLALKEKEAERQRAMRALAEDTEELTEKYGL